MFDYVIVGAGFSGAVMAEQIANRLNGKVLVIEKRNHIGGNAYDKYDDNGILVHQYGPHIFHTRAKEVWDYVSQFTEWNHYQHRVVGHIDGHEVPIPFNLKSLHALLPKTLAVQLEIKLIEKFGYNSKVPILKLRETEDEQLKWLAGYVYEKVFLNYTTKQWGMTPEQLDSAVTGRVPVFVSHDDRYFQDPYQGLPKHGYYRVFEKLLTHPNIKLMLNTDFGDVLNIGMREGDTLLFGQPYFGKIIYTGKIDELFAYEYGELPYRSLNFQFEHRQIPLFQQTGTVNYPNDYAFTRITEFKHLTGQMHPNSTIVTEYPQAYNKNVVGQNVPYYPIPHTENQELFKRYWAKSKEYRNLILLGRLAEYKYYDMDACIAKALKVFEQKIL